MTGICGSLSNKVKNGHIVVALNAIQHDVTAAGSGEDVFNLYDGRTAPIETTKSIVRKIKKYDLMIQFTSVRSYLEISVFVVPK